MKKVFLILVAVLGLGFAANAQNWIGVRGAFGSSSGAELSWQHAMSHNRLELDLGWNTHKNKVNNTYYGYYNLTGIYQWTGGISGNFGWFAGLGANLGYWNGYVDQNFGLGFLIQGGLEYNFNIPLQITLDARPQWDVLGAASGFGYGIALGLRFRF